MLKYDFAGTKNPKYLSGEKLVYMVCVSLNEKFELKTSKLVHIYTFRANRHFIAFAFNLKKCQHSLNNERVEIIRGNKSLSCFILIRIRSSFVQMKKYSRPVFRRSSSCSRHPSLIKTHKMEIKEMAPGKSSC